MSAAAATGKPIKGPSALGDDFRRFVHLSVTLAITEFKLRFFGSVLGYVWQLFRPLMLFGVLYIVFTEFVRLGGGVAHYPVVLLTGIVLFTFFAEATGGSVTSVLDREQLVRKIQFPRLVIPIAVVLTATFNLVLNLLAVGVFLALSGVEPRLTWLQVPLLLGGVVLLALGVSMLLSALYVRFRDVKPIWEVLLQVLFYSSPILYPIEVIPSERAQELIMLSPLAMFLQQTRYALIDPAAPSAATAARGPWWLAVPIGLMIVLAIVGLWYFNRQAPRVAEEL